MSEEDIEKNGCYESKKRFGKNRPILVQLRYVLVHVCVLICFSHVQSFVTPGIVAHQIPIHGILQARILEWVAMSFSKEH